jgi:hypothetical protein
VPTLTPANEPPPPPISDSQPPAPPMNDVRDWHPHDPDGRGVVRTAGWVSLAIGAEAALVGIFTGLIMLHDDHVRTQECPNKQCPAGSQGDDANTAIGNLAPWNAGAWIVAAVGIGVGAVLLISTSPSKSEKGQESGSTSVGVAPGGITLRSTF